MSLTAARRREIRSARSPSPGQRGPSSRAAIRSGTIAGRGIGPDEAGTFGSRVSVSLRSQTGSEAVASTLSPYPARPQARVRSRAAQTRRPKSAGASAHRRVRRSKNAGSSGRIRASCIGLSIRCATRRASASPSSRRASRAGKSVEGRTGEEGGAGFLPGLTTTATMKMERMPARIQEVRDMRGGWRMEVRKG